MTPRWITRELREFPATFVVCVSWVLVFAAITYEHLATGEPLSLSRWLLLGFGGGERFGDLTLRELARWQVWRLVTCNFVHYSVVHVGLNVLAMYQIGSLVESWYGSSALWFLYVLTGTGGNLLASLARLGTHAEPTVHAAGGSVVIMGLVGLCAVVGWRSKNPEGRWLGRLMLGFIVGTALLGACFPNYIDNWGHAGGLVMGAAAGLAHRQLRASVHTPWIWGAGVLSLLLIAGSVTAQVVVDQRDSRQWIERIVARRSDFLVRSMAELKKLRRPEARSGQVEVPTRLLGSLAPYLDGPGRDEIRRLEKLVARMKNPPLAADEERALDASLNGLHAAVRRRYDDDRRLLRRLQQSR